MMYQKQIDAYFTGREDALLSPLSRLVAIPSVKGPPAPGAPFGEGPARALEQALAICDEMGFSTGNVDGYVGTADLNDRETALHILCHLDVVDGGAGWTKTDPFCMAVEGDRIYGRGVSDDKGPLVCAMLAMKAVGELGVPLRRNVRLIMGTDEECGSSDIAYYYSRHPYAPYTFSPDAEFPLIHIEKGHYRPCFGMRWEKGGPLPRVTLVEGGKLLNAVPAQAQAFIEGMDPEDVRPHLASVSRATGAAFSVTPREGGLSVLCTGTSAHAAAPQEGVNALTALLSLLAALPLADAPSAGALRALHRLFPHGDHGGSALGIAQSDELSGPLTLNLSLMDLNEEGVAARFDSRTPLCATEQTCKKVAEAALARHGFSLLSDGAQGPAHHTPEDSPFVRTLLSCYERYTGRPGHCAATGGGTYVHGIPGGVAFGCAMPGFDTRMHAPDEVASLSDLMTACRIFTQAIIDLCSD